MCIRDRVSTQSTGGDADSAMFRADEEITDLVVLAEKGRSDRVLELLQQGHDVNARDALGTSPLMAAARMGHADLVKKLLGTGALCGVADNAGRTALIEAASGGMVYALRELLQSNDCAIQHRESVSGLTALFLAARRGCSPAVQMLLEAGADPSIRSNTGETPLRAAEKAGCAETEALLRVPVQLRTPPKQSQAAVEAAVRKTITAEEARRRREIEEAVQREREAHEQQRMEEQRQQQMERLYERVLAEELAIEQLLETRANELEEQLRSEARHQTEREELAAAEASRLDQVG
eukprot:TRINITY_DN4323_c0_g1_i2.p2 TRINITY_DN4323_c0_g1~~TRINITY_DN4323_c0_g1_i2.p2  ORF type:complete len:294 (+),score=98.41 TRINITY_DN4323_c0_g1_i2:97-978(+)